MAGKKTKMWEVWDMIDSTHYCSSWDEAIGYMDEFLFARIKSLKPTNKKPIICVLTQSLVEGDPHGHWDSNTREEISQRTITVIIEDTTEEKK